MVRKGFTLVELMIVILIVAILAAVAIPLMTGRIDAAKWSEGKSAMGTIATAVRAYYAEKGCDPAPSAPSLNPADPGFIGVTAQDLDGTYFEQTAAVCYSIVGGSTGCVPSTGQVFFSIRCDAGPSTRPGAPTKPSAVTLIQTAGNPAAFVDIP